MIITFQLGGQERIVKWDGSCFAAHDSNGITIAYCQTLGNAVMAHVKDVARLDTYDNKKLVHEKVELTALVERFNRIYNDIRSINEDDIPSLSKEEKPDNNQKYRRGVTVEEEHLKKQNMKAVSEIVIAPEEVDDFDDL